MVAVMASYSAGSSIWSMFARASVASQSNPLAAHASVQLWPSSDVNQPVVGGGEGGCGNKGGLAGGGRAGSPVALHANHPVGLAAASVAQTHLCCAGVDASNWPLPHGATPLIIL